MPTTTPEAASEDDRSSRLATTLPDLVAALGPTISPTDAEALDPWRLGDLVTCPPLAWATDAGAPDAITGRPALSGAGLAIDTLEPGPGALALVCSQTCDVVGAGPGARMPFVQVSPVFDFTGDEEKWDQLRRGEVWNAFGIQGPPGTPRRVVDLRISVPLSKQHLVNSTRTFAFADPLDAQRLAVHLAARIERAALHDFLADTVRNTLATAVSKRKSTHKWLRGVREVRLTVFGDRLKPTNAGLFLVWHTQWSEEQQNDAFAFGQQFRKPAAALGIRWMDTMSVLESQGGVAAYRDSVRLYLPGLNGP